MTTMLDHKSQSHQFFEKTQPRTVKKSILDDLCCRFVANMPAEQLDDPVRICFQVELAYWFYVDYFQEEAKKCSLREFIKTIFNYLPCLKQHSSSVEKIIEQWRQYKSMVPTYGAILLDEPMENIVLVQGEFAKSSWGFPKGKVNENEAPHKCAMREVLEETGYDVSPSIDENQFFERKINDTMVRLYLVPNVDKKFAFHPLTRNEIRDIKWFRLDDFPDSKTDTSKCHLGMYAGRFFGVIPFVQSTRDWVRRRRGLSPLPRPPSCNFDWASNLCDFADWSTSNGVTPSNGHTLHSSAYSSPNFRNSAHPAVSTYENVEMSNGYWSANSKISGHRSMGGRSRQHGCDKSSNDHHQVFSSSQKMHVERRRAKSINDSSAPLSTAPSSTNRNEGHVRINQSALADSGRVLPGVSPIISVPSDRIFVPSTNRRGGKNVTPSSATNHRRQLNYEATPTVLNDSQPLNNSYSFSNCTSSVGKHKKRPPMPKQRLNFDTLTLNDTTKPDSASSGPIRLVEKWRDVQFDWSSIFGKI